jgi:acyl carrier protein
VIEDRIRRFIVEELHAPTEELSPEFPLIEGGVVDSLGIMHLVSFIESEYGITVDDEELVSDNFGSIREIARFVGSKTASSI